MRKTLTRIVTTGVSLTLLSTLAQSAFAQVSSTGSSTLTKGGLGGGAGTGSALPAAGSVDITYLIFGFGIILFVFGMMKMVTSFKD